LVSYAELQAEFEKARLNLPPFRIQGHGYNVTTVESTLSPARKSVLVVYGMRKTSPASPNAQYLGTVKSGGTIIWDRAPGSVRLEVISLGGDQAFAPPFEVQAGKTYVVNYDYPGARFEIREQ
jgi:hypothetical protein